MYQNHVDGALRNPMFKEYCELKTLITKEKQFMSDGIVNFVQQMEDVYLQCKNIISPTCKVKSDLLIDLNIQM